MVLVCLPASALAQQANTPTGGGAVPVPGATSSAAAAVAAAGRSPAEIAQSLGYNATGLTLVDALRGAIKTNTTLAIAVVEVDIAHAQVMQALGLDDFQLQINGDYTHQKADPVSGAPFQNTGLDQVHGSIGLTKPLRTGGTLGIKFDLPFSRQSFLVDAGALGTTKSSSDSWSPALQLSFNHPLLRGFGTAIARARQRSAAASLTAANIKQSAEAIQELQKVVNAYWELAFVYRDYEIKESSLELAREQLKVTQAQVDVGRLPKMDALAVEQAVAEREEQVLEAKIALADRSLVAREALGMPISAHAIYLAASDLPATDGGAIDVDATLKKALVNNPGLRMLRATTEIDQINIEVARNALMPELDLSATFGPVGRSDTAGDAFDRLVKLKTYNAFVGAQLSVPIGNHAAKGTLEAARAGQRRTTMQIADAERLLVSQTVRLANQAQAAGQRLQVTRKAVELAILNLDAEHSRYDVGRATLFNILERQDALRAAQEREVRARVDYLETKAAVDYVTGDLLTSYGLALR